jgi:vancomycin resistance protein YoaR
VQCCERPVIAKESSISRMKKFFIISLTTLALIAAAIGIASYRYVPCIRPNTLVGDVQLGGLNQKEAAEKLRTWWTGERKNRITLTSRLLGKKTILVSPEEIGIDLDVLASVRQAHFNTLWERTVEIFKKELNERLVVEPIFDLSKTNLARLKGNVESTIGGRRPARAYLVGDAIQKEPEVSGSTLDEVKFKELLASAVVDKKPVDIPLVQAPKKVNDGDLDKITDVVSRFSTRFPARQYSRTSNIQNASSKINGIVLAPGERFSFNELVGRRTLKNGFKLAPVYKDGKHDIGVGGGICQVSTTLYNAALFADLKIVRRQNHSMPVAYVPVGRDATVDYGAIDLVIENNYDTPIAINSRFVPGSLTFTILGKKKEGLSVKIITSGHRSWNPGIKTVVDPTLSEGKTKVIEKGCLGHSIHTYRLVYEFGQLLRRDSLGQSFYKGGVRIVATGTKKLSSVAVMPHPNQSGLE